MKAKAFFQLAWLLFFAFASSRPSLAADRLLRLVGSDVGICVEASNLGKRLPVLADSQLAERLQNSSFYRQWRESKDYRKLEHAREIIEKLTGKPFEQFATELFGESVVLALYPAGGDKLAGVLLTQTSKEKDLQAALDAWNGAEPRHRLERLEHAGQTYFRRTKPPAGKKRGEVLYYVTLGRLFAFSDTESLIQQVIELNRASTGNGPTNAKAAGDAGRECLFDSASYQTARRSLSPDSVVSVYLNPRQLDDAIKPKPHEPDPPQALVEIWRRCESLVFGIRLGEGIVVEAVAHYKQSDASGKWTRLIERTSGPPDFLQRVPRNALAAVAGQHDLDGLSQLVLEQMPKPKRQQLNAFRQIARGLLLGLDLFDDVLPNLKPNWVLYVVPAQQSRGDAPPVDGLLALELPADAKPNAARRKANLRDALHNGLNTALHLAVAAHNGKSPKVPAIVRDTEVPYPGQTDKVLVRWIEGMEPYQPAYAITPNHLIFSSSRKLIEEFISTEPEERLISDDGFQRWRESFFPQASQVLFVNVARVRDFVAGHREYFVRQAVRRKTVDAAEAARRVKRLDDVLQLADGAFMAARIADDHVRLVVGVALAEPAGNGR